MDRQTEAAAEFVRAALAARLGLASLDEARRLTAAPGFAWTAVADLATREAVEPLLYATLRGLPWAPAGLMAQWRQVYMGQGLRNALLLRELEAVMAALAEAAIPALVLKGPALVLRVYGNPALRPMVDLDLLLRREDVPAAQRRLERLGYRPALPEPADGLTLAFENELLLVRGDRTETALELHWSLFDSPYYQHRLPLAWFWETAAEAQVGHTPVRILGPEAELLYLCGHLALHHRGEGLLWQHDLAALLAAGAHTLDWDGLLARAQQLELLLPLQTLLPILARRWAAPVPAAVLERLAGLRPTPQEARVFRQLTTHQRPVLQRLAADLAGIPTWRGRLRYAWCNLFPSADYMRQRYAVRHGALLPLYYP
ncbi:MAG: nucleotidyltransferase family protein, partial [Caldilineales bacterium]|nr:nucleotidyltransferase family protein [Caldilineales bacterium]